MIPSSDSPPLLAIFILKLILPDSLCQELLGDLQEEFTRLAESSQSEASRWYWQQALRTAGIYLAKAMLSTSTARHLNLLVGFALFQLSFLLVIWLSYGDNFIHFSVGFFDQILAGKAHLALFEPQFWHNLPVVMSRVDETDFLIHPPSVFLVLLLSPVLLHLARSSTLSTTRLAAIAYLIALAPYIVVVSYLTINTLPAQQVGPVLATGLISFLYLILPASWVVNHRLSQQRVFA